MHISAEPSNDDIERAVADVQSHDWKTARRAFEIMQEHYYPIVLRDMRSFVGIEDSEDLAQDCFISAWVKRHKYNPNHRGEDGNKTTYRAWLMAIARHLAISLIRRKNMRFKKMPTERLADGLDSIADRRNEPDLADCEYAEKNSQALWDCIDNLPPVYAAIYYSIYEGGLTFDECADALNLPKGTPRSRSHRMRKWLRKCLLSKGIQPPNSPSKSK